MQRGKKHLIGPVCLRVSVCLSVSPAEHVSGTR